MNNAGAIPPVLFRRDRMELTVESVNRRFSVYMDYIITETDSYGEKIVAASIGGNQSAVSAVAASIISGFNTRLTYKGNEILLRSLFGDYKKVTGQLNNRVHHCVIVAKDSIYNEKSKTPVIFAPDGNLPGAVGAFLSARYSLPREWEDQYYSILPFDSVIELKVITNNPQWKNLKAVKLKNIKESSLLQLIGSKLKSGQLQIPPSKVEGVYDPDWSINQYLMANAPVLAKQISELGAYFIPGRDRISPEIASMLRTPFPAQAYVIQGVVNYLNHQSAPKICGDMSTGKTIMSIGIIHVLHKERNIKRVIISVPELVLEKWAGEIRMTIPYAKVRFIRSTQDALEYAREVKSGVIPETLEIVLVGINRAKFGPEPWCAAIWRRVSGTKLKTWHCPRCGRPLPHSSVLKKVKEKLKEGINPQDIDYEIQSEWKDMVKKPAAPPAKSETTSKNFNNIPRGYIKKWNNDSKLKKCPWCDEKLWRPASKRLGETRNRPRWFVCKIIKKLKKAFQLYICDEVHQAKASNSGRGYAFGQLVKSAEKSVSLTGTLTNGKSTSIRSILFRTNPRPLIEDGFTYEVDDLKWVKEYGTLEKLVKKKDQDDDLVDNGVITVRKGRNERLIERPGISPRLVTKYLLSNTVFLELSDLELPIVEIKEQVELLDMDEEYDFAHNYKTFHNSFIQACREAFAKKGVSAWSSFNPAMLNYADQPHLGAYHKIGDKIVFVPATPKDFFHAKERWLVGKIRSELEEGRGVIVFTNYSGRYGINKRLQYVLEKHGIKAKTLETNTCRVDERIEWVARRAEEGTKVIITNKELLEVGVDIIPFQTCINYQLTFKVNTERQANRRNLRIGQTKEVRIIYPVYNNTQQINQLRRVMAGRGQAMLAEGRLDKSELAEFALDTHTAMTYSLARCLAESDLADKWTRLAAKDIDKKLELVSEEMYKTEFAAAKKRLVRKTLSLCGVEETEIEKRLVPDTETAETIFTAKQEEFVLFGEDALENELPEMHKDTDRWLHGLFDDCEQNAIIPIKKTKKPRRRREKPKKQNIEQLELLSIKGA